MKKTAKQMIVMRIIYSIFKTFVLIFVNIYLWKSGKDIKAVAIFNIFNYIGATISFYLANRIAVKNTKYNYIFSSISFIGLFLAAVVLGDDLSKYAIAIGFLGGFGDGFFFFNLNTFQAIELDKDEIDQFMSLMGAYSKISSIIAPIFTGVVIEVYGFKFMVMILIGLVIVQFIISLMMPSSNIEAVGKVDFRKLIKKSNLKKVFLTHSVRAPYNQFTILTTSVFLFAFVKSESIMGVLNSAFSIVAIILFVLYRYMQRFYTKKKLMLWGAIGHSLAMLVLFKASFIAFIIYSVSISFGTAFFSTPLTGIQVHTSKKYSVDQEDMLGNLMIRVIMLTIGRSSFYFLILLFYKDLNSGIFTFFVVYNTVSPLISYYLVKEEI